MRDEYLFISDCHLDARRPEISAALAEFINHRAQSASRLYILGDLFEVWLGDDDPAVEHRATIDVLRRLAEYCEIYFMAGNRDFLIGQAFAADVGLELLDEPELLNLGEHRVVLLHGDTLCTDDHDYQAFRQQVRSFDWQRQFLAHSLEQRQQIAARLRSDSNDAMAQKSLQIMDVNQDAVEQCFHSNQVDTLIHGHTHRPAVHHYDLDLTRYVLGDWNPGPSFLSWSETRGFRLNDSRV